MPTRYDLKDYEPDEVIPTPLKEARARGDERVMRGPTRTDASGKPVGEEPSMTSMRKGRVFSGENAGEIEAEWLPLAEGKMKAGDEAGGVGVLSAGVYSADGDPYLYRVEPDGSVTILGGPTGKGMNLTKGAPFDAIKSQIMSGQLVRDERDLDPSGTPVPTPLKAARADRSMRDALNESVAKHMTE